MKSKLKIFGVIGPAFLLAAAGFVLFWGWSTRDGLKKARKEFETASYAIETKILNEMGLFSSSEVKYFVDTRRFSFDSKKGLVRHFPVGQIEIYIYFPKDRWDKMMTEGSGQLEKSRSYNIVRNKIISYYDERFTDPWLSQVHASHLKVLYQVKAAPENRSREEMMAAFKNYHP